MLWLRTFTREAARLTLRARTVSFRVSLYSRCFMRLSFAASLFWLSVACCAVAQVFIIRSVLVTRHRADSDAVQSRSHPGVEIAWAVLPAIALAVLLGFTWQAVRAH